MPLSNTLIAMLGLMVSFGLPLAVVALVLHYRHAREKMTHETVSKLIERGLPVPPELLNPPHRGQAGLRGGLVLVALGIALAAFFQDHGPGWSVGLIPGLMGVALLIAWVIEQRSRR